MEILAEENLDLELGVGVWRGACSENEDGDTLFEQNRWGVAGLEKGGPSDASCAPSLLPFQTVFFRVSFTPS